MRGRARHRNPPRHALTQSHSTRFAAQKAQKPRPPGAGMTTAMGLVMRTTLLVGCAMALTASLLHCSGGSTEPKVKEAASSLARDLSPNVPNADRAELRDGNTAFA